MGNETSLAQKTKIEQSFFTFLEIVYLEVSKELKKYCTYEIFVPKPKLCIYCLGIWFLPPEYHKKL